MRKSLTEIGRSVGREGWSGREGDPEEMPRGRRKGSRKIGSKKSREGGQDINIC